MTPQETCLWVSRNLRWRRGSVVACWSVVGTDCSSTCLGSLEGGHHYLHYLHIVWPQVSSREGAQLHPSTENWTKDLLSMALPIRTRARIPLSQSLPSGSFYKPLILLHQRTGSLKTTITENQPIWSHEPQPCLTQWNYEPWPVGPPRTDGSWWRLLTKCGPLEKGMANHFSIFALRTPWTVWTVWMVLEHMVVIFVIFWETIIFSIVAAPFYIPLNLVIRLSISPHPCQYLPSFLKITILTDHLIYDVMFHCNLDLHFPNN